MKFSLREIAIVGIFSALAYAGAYLVAAVHNIEFLTSIIFLSGLLFGKKQGTLVGLLSSSLYAIFNPWGISPLPLFLAQVFSRGLVGLVGGMFGALPLGRRPSWLRSLCFGLTGLVLTFVYLVLAQLSYMFSSGFEFEQLMIFFTVGIPSSLILLFSNTLIFSVAIPFMADRLRSAIGGQAIIGENAAQKMRSQRS